MMGSHGAPGPGVFVRSRPRAATVVGACLMLAGGPALAQALPPDGRTAQSDITLLHLSATGTVRETPDLLVAQLVAESTSGNPSTAQQRVNRLMQDAGAAAAKLPSVHWRLDGYGVDRGGDRTPVWTARQTLRLEGADAGMLLELVSRLQAAGLVIGELSWTLSPQHLAAARAQASDQALKALRTRAEAAAGSLGLRVGTIRDVTLGEGEPIRPMMRLMAATMSTPQATQDAQDVNEDASATIELRR